MSGGGDDVALKLLHTADWHLGRRFPSFKEADQPKLTRARLDVVDRVLNEAESNQVDALLCAGDLFDGPDPLPEWWEKLAERFARRSWSDRPVFLLPGNHDPLREGSVYWKDHPFRRALPPWVHVVDRDDFTFELKPGEAVLHSIPCRSQAGESDLALRLPGRAPGDERIRVGLVHGQTFDIPGYETNFPISKDAPALRGFDYLALGDTHQFREVQPGAEAPMIYPSAPEQATFGETETGYVALVFFRRKRRRPIVERVRVAQWTWRTERVRDLASLRALRDTESLRQTVLRLQVEMALSPAEFKEAEAILRELEGSASTHARVGILQLEREELKLDTRDVQVAFADLPAVLQAAAARLAERSSQGDDQAAARRALYHLYLLARGGAAG